MPAINNTTNAQLSNAAALVGKRFATEARNATQGGSNQPTMAKDGLTLSGNAKRVGEGGLGLNPANGGVGLNPADAKDAKGGSANLLELLKARAPKAGDQQPTVNQLGAKNAEA